MNTCICAACGTEKQTGDFYANDRKCKTCRKAMLRASRASNIDAVRLYDRQRASQPDRVAARKVYAATAEGQAARQRARDRWASANKRERAAHVAVGNALRDGRLFKLPCWTCGEREVEGHHPDYDAQLDVVWLCAAHHREIHLSHPHDK